jgi:hypothetical protein
VPCAKGRQRKEHEACADISDSAGFEEFFIASWDDSLRTDVIRFKKFKSL